MTFASVDVQTLKSRHHGISRPSFELRLWQIWIRTLCCSTYPNSHPFLSMGGASTNHLIDWHWTHRVHHHWVRRRIHRFVWNLFTSHSQNCSTHWRKFATDSWWRWDHHWEWCGCGTSQSLAPFPLQSSGCQLEWAVGHAVDEHLSIPSLSRNSLELWTSCQGILLVSSIVV